VIGVAKDDVGPAARTPSGLTALTVAAVPTGMKAWRADLAALHGDGAKPGTAVGGLDRESEAGGHGRGP
jgi:hypothetical protein